MGAALVPTGLLRAADRGGGSVLRVGFVDEKGTEVRKENIIQINNPLYVKIVFVCPWPLGLQDRLVRIG